MDAGLAGGFFWSMALIAAILVGMSKGGLPLVGMLAVPILSLATSPVTAAGLLLPVYVVSDMFGLYAYRGSFDRRVIAIVAAGASVGVALGGATASVTPAWVVTILVGVIGLIFALNLLIKRSAPTPRKAEVAPGLFWGTITGFTSFVSHAGAPPYQVYVMPLQLPKLVFAGTSTILFAYINAIKLIPYAMLGQLSLQNLKVAAALMPASALAVYGGVWATKRLPERLFFQIVTWALLALSIKLIWDGARAAGF